VTEPDDIDALLTAENTTDELSTDANADVTESDDIDALLTAENTTDELSTDANADVTELDDIDALLTAENATNELSTDANKLFDEDELDIDVLTSQVDNEKSNDGADLDIGDDLFADIESVNESDNIFSGTIDDETMEAISADFDESTLTQLLNDEKDGVELSPDFIDKKVLADLLSDVYDTDVVHEASEVEDIQELDNLDFDELLANIEEESEVITNFDALNIDNELNVKDIVREVEQDDESVQDFISVNSLLSESLDKDSVGENYDKDNIDVGLDGFPEFTANVDVDVDEDQFGFAAKLDIANVYIEIGDLDNAEIILTNIVSLGDEQQQVAAQKLLDEINS